MTSRRFLCLILVLMVSAAATTSAQTLNTFFYFDGIDGSLPGDMGFVQGRDGELYGTTQNGGVDGDGTVFRITTNGIITTLHSFCPEDNCSDGMIPEAGVVLGDNGTFYGSTSFGGNSICQLLGCGTLFKMSSEGSLTTLHRFDSGDGELPVAPLVQGVGGTFYGTTQWGGHFGNCATLGNGCGTVFEMIQGGTFTTLDLFTGPPGGVTPNGLILGSDGNFYGTTAGGGDLVHCYLTGCGLAFRMTPAGEVTTIYAFCQKKNCVDGAEPTASLTEGLDGDLYGITLSGGANGYGTVFRMTHDGHSSILYNFCSLPDCADGGTPLATLIQATDGNFYGTTSYTGDETCNTTCGTIFQMTPEGELTTLYTFSGPAGYYLPTAPLFQDTNGLLYGTNSMNDSVFSLDMGLGPFIAFVRPFGKVGEIGGILGQGFIGTTNVSINGVSADFTVVSDTYLTATVPEGATSGYVTVATPSGNLTSNMPFQVVP
jgi:uncharacterized repeat protein (TIGR03803 family)